MKIYTRTGDDGTTSLSGGRRIPKHHIRVEAYGSVDELTAWIGLLRDHRENETRREILIYIQDQLMRCEAILACEENSPDRNKYLPEKDSVERLEREIDRMALLLPPLKNFVLPGGHKLVSYCHLARCVCRRAERTVLRLSSSEAVPEIIHKFLNRLSDYLFMLARLISLEHDIEEVIWSL